MEMNEVWEMLAPILIDALSIVVLALASAVAAKIAAWAKSKGINELIDAHEKWAALAVRTAEDIYATGEGDAKLDYACEWLADRLRENKIPVDAEAIEGLIRAAYQEIIGEWDKEMDADYLLEAMRAGLVEVDD
jgi:hypothetical protein